MKYLSIRMQTEHRHLRRVLKFIRLASPPKLYTQYIVGKGRLRRTACKMYRVSKDESYPSVFGSAMGP